MPYVPPTGRRRWKAGSFCIAGKSGLVGRRWRRSVPPAFFRVVMRAGRCAGAGGDLLKQSPLTRAESAARREAERMGLEWVDVELAKEPAGRFLRIFVDKPAGVELNDLETYHKAVQPLFDDVDYDYMEVSSPGVDRPLKKPGDYARAVGSQVELRFYRPQEGQKQVTGTLAGLFDGAVRLVVDGEEREYPLKAIALAKPVVEIDESILSDSSAEEDDIEE